MHALTKTPREMASLVLKWARADHNHVVRSRPDEGRDPFDVGTVLRVETGCTYVTGFLFAARPMIAAVDAELLLPCTASDFTHMRNAVRSASGKLSPTGILGIRTARDAQGRT